ncbi:MAG: beta-galactosidase [Dictyoglomaceae bacterium]
MILPIENKDIPQIRRELEGIKSLGFNSVRFWYDWASAEPEPNKWNFKEIDILLSITDELNIKALVQVYIDSAPNWVEIEYPDSLFEDRAGLKIHSQASPGYCSDHPRVREHITEYLKRLAQVVSSHPSFFAWDIWSEPHIVQWSWIDFMYNPWFCYCENSKKRFIGWLKRKYKDIEELNRVWYRKHRDWEEVVIPRYTSLSTFSDLLDWIQFNIEKIAEDLEWKVSIIKSVDKNHIVSSHAAISSIYSIPGISYGSSDDWRLAEKVDVWGTSFYPKHTGPWMPLKPHQMGVALDATRSSCESKGKPFWIGELQTGHGVTGMLFSVPVNEKDVDRWAWLAVSRGATGLNYYAWFPMSCGYEVSGFGLANPDGSGNERVYSAGNVSKIITENMETFLDIKPLPAQVAILYDIEAYKLLACLRAQSAEIIRKDIFGIYKALMRENIPVDFIHLFDLNIEKLRNYKIIFAPFAISLTESGSNSLKEYVKFGGILIADGRIAWTNDKGWLMDKIPGFSLDEVFGCIETYMTEMKEPFDIEVKDFGMIKGINYLSSYNVTSGKVIGSYKNVPVIIENKYFKGKAIMIGTLLGFSIEAGYDENIDFILKLLKDSQVSPYFELKSESKDVEVKCSRRENEGVFFVFNYSNNPQNIEITFKKDLFPFTPKKIIDLKTKEEYELKIIEEKFKISLEISSEDTKVLKIE